MSVFKRAWAVTAGLVTVTALTVGCQDRVTQEDVNEGRRDAAEAVQEAQHEIAETHAEQNRQIAMVEQEREQEIADLRRDLAKPDANVAEIRADIADANRDADQKIADIRKDIAEETIDARDDAVKEVREAQQTEANYNAQQARDAYLKQTEERLVQMDTQIAQLRERGDTLQGAERDGFDESLDLVDSRRKAVDKAVDELESAELQDWKSFQDEVENAMKQLKSSFDTAAAQIKA